jgi:bacillithiol system protein YtxJ
MEWEILTELQQLEDIRRLSGKTSVLIYKHSTRCPTSRLILERLERSWKNEHRQHLKAFFLDLITYREISNALTVAFGVEHESPQVMLIQNGKSVYDTSHFGISYSDILTAAKNFERLRQPCA